MKLTLMTSLALPFATAMTSEETAAQHNPAMMSWGAEKSSLSVLAKVVDVACTYDNVGQSGDGTCGRGRFCMVSAGQCNLRSAFLEGTCAPIPQMCTLEYDPVCGCDGVTYSNACVAQSAGVSVSRDRACDDQNASPAMPGSDYCTWSPDNECYVNGWPQCCMEDDQDCPPDRQPRCDNHDTTGWDYCTWSPDETCYESGWPACCDRFDGTNCPTDKPNCDVTPTENSEDDVEVKDHGSPAMPGSSYCTWSPDYDCFVEGWPQCCTVEGQDCPPDRRPRCDNHDNYGWNYCTLSPDNSCYETGWPMCCRRFGGTNCPTDKPNCDVTTTENSEDGVEIKFLRTGR